jgi:hypothetical protein
MGNSISSLIPELQPFCRDLIAAAGAARLMPQLTSTRRSHAEQERLYRRYLAGQQAYPVARPGTSAHEYGWAFDMVVSPLYELADVGALWESWGGIWGGHPHKRGSGYDPVHFEYPGFVLGAIRDVRGQLDDRDLGGFWSEVEDALGVISFVWTPATTERVEEGRLGGFFRSLIGP